MIDTGTPTVRAWVAGAVGVVELHRPDRRNALHPDMYDAVPAVLERFGADDDVGCIVVTGAGSAFCAGGDVRAGAERGRAEHDGPGLAHDARMVAMLHESPKLSIAALPGPAVGAGLALALAADFRVAAESATLTAGWGRLGLSGDFGGPWLLTRLLGPARALAFLVEDRTVDAAAALDLGLVHRVVPDAAVREEAMAWAGAVAAGPRAAYALMKENVRDAEVVGLRHALAAEGGRMRKAVATDDHRRALKRWLAEAEARRAARDVTR